MRRPQNLKEISDLFWQNSGFYSVVSKQVGDFFKFSCPFQKSWTLTLSTNIVLNLQCKDLIISNLRYCICLYWLGFPSWYFGSKTVQIKLCSTNIGTKCTSNGVHLHHYLRRNTLGSGILAWKKDLTHPTMADVFYETLPKKDRERYKIYSMANFVASLSHLSHEATKLTIL